MKKLIMFTCSVLACILTIGIGCSKPDSQIPTGTPAPSGAATPEDLAKNFLAAAEKKDAAGIVACISKKMIKEIGNEARRDAEKDADSLKKKGITKEDLTLSDEKLAAKAFDQDKEMMAEVAEFKYVENKINGDKGAVTLKNPKGKTLTMLVTKEDGFWKIEDMKSGGLNEAQETGVRATLMSLRSAQAMYKMRYSAYGTLAQLAESQMISDNALASGNKYGYKFTVEPEQYKFTATAVPDDAAMNSYRVTESGVIEKKAPGEADYKECND